MNVHSTTNAVSMLGVLTHQVRMLAAVGMAIVEMVHIVKISMNVHTTTTAVSMLSVLIHQVPMLANVMVSQNTTSN